VNHWLHGTESHDGYSDQNCEVYKDWSIGKQTFFLQNFARTVDAVLVTPVLLQFSLALKRKR
jgi:hypothetical protein